MTKLDQNFISQNLHQGNIAFEEKETVKTMSKGAINEYILAFAGWKFIFWVVVGGGGCIVAGGE